MSWQPTCAKEIYSLMFFANKTLNTNNQIK